MIGISLRMVQWPSLSVCAGHDIELWNPPDGIRGFLARLSPRLQLGNQSVLDMLLKQLCPPIDKYLLESPICLTTLEEGSLGV